MRRLLAEVQASDRGGHAGLETEREKKAELDCVSKE